MPKVSKLYNRWRVDDPNNVHNMTERYNCKMINDYNDWNNLNGQVKVYQLSSDEVKRLCRKE